ncbi:hypothetical protein [Herpetosiphon giganteus]|uniref:hypothetical protein n=1 Tax=Herpetosiphon giganteus TaxID=2029754 RepID=UPI001956C26A|nr:hypothetical protein [Herpetosiphon giganteus]MBM7846242.1 hypothetical protein [Herpetosiphon giganteus]
MKKYRIFVNSIVFGSLLLVACGRTTLPAPSQIPDPRLSQSQPMITATSPTPTANLTATILDQTAVVEGATKEAEYLAVEQRFADETATSLAEPYRTMLPMSTFEPVTPSPTWEYRLFEHLECTTDEPGRPMFITNCWHGESNNKDFIVRGYGIRDKSSEIIYDGFLQVFENDVLVYRYYLPSNTSALTIVQELSPYLVISVGDQYEVLFNLETYQWANRAGTPIPVTATPTSADK